MGPRVSDYSTAAGIVARAQAGDGIAAWAGIKTLRDLCRRFPLDELLAQYLDALLGIVEQMGQDIAAAAETPEDGNPRATLTRLRKACRIDGIGPNNRRAEQRRIVGRTAAMRAWHRAIAAEIVEGVPARITRAELVEIAARAAGVATSTARAWAMPPELVEQPEIKAATTVRKARRKTAHVKPKSWR